MRLIAHPLQQQAKGINYGDVYLVIVDGSLEIMWLQTKNESSLWSYLSLVTLYSLTTLKLYAMGSGRDLGLTLVGGSVR